jgi:hypothetical protein
MRHRRYLLVTVCIALGAVFGGCIFDSDEECEPRSAVVGCILDMAAEPMVGIKVLAVFDPMEGVDPVPDCSTYTNWNGCYSIQYPASASHVYVYPPGDGCVFAPYGRHYDDPDGILYGQDYVGYCGETYRVSGHISDDEGHDLAGVYVTLKDSYGFWRDDTVTDAVGYYVFDGLAPNVEYVLRPADLCEYDPPYRTYTVVTENLTGQDFVRTGCMFHTVEGYVLDAQGLPVAGIALRSDCICLEGVLGASHTVYTDTAGHYSLELLTPPDCGCYVIPKSEVCRFLPHYRSYGSLEDDLTGENYTAYCGDGYDIDGYVRTPEGEPCESTYIHMWRRDWEDQESEYLRVVTDDTGYYMFDNLVPGVIYDILPSTSQYPSGGPCTFEPPMRSYAALDGDKHDKDFIQDCP